MYPIKQKPQKPQKPQKIKKTFFFILVVIICG